MNGYAWTALEMDNLAFEKFQNTVFFKIFKSPFNEQGPIWEFQTTGANVNFINCPLSIYVNDPQVDFHN